MGMMLRSEFLEQASLLPVHPVFAVDAVIADSDPEAPLHYAIWPGYRNRKRKGLIAVSTASAELPIDRWDADASLGDQLDPVSTAAIFAAVRLLGGGCAAGDAMSETLLTYGIERKPGYLRDPRRPRQYRDRLTAGQIRVCDALGTCLAHSIDPDLRLRIHLTRHDRETVRRAPVLVPMHRTA